MLDRLCRVIEWLCFIPLIITIYLLVALVTNVIIDANTPLQEMKVGSEFVSYDDSHNEYVTIDGVKHKIGGKYVSITGLRKPEDMYQLPADVSLGLLSFFSIIVYAFIYIVRGKVRFLPWK